MISLEQNRETMLADIGATEEAFANRVDDPSDPRFLEHIFGIAVQHFVKRLVLQAIATGNETPFGGLHGIR